jgi:acylpyruvate hydrolase
MRLLTLTVGDTTSAAVLEPGDDGKARLLPYPDVQTLLRSSRDWRDEATTRAGELVRFEPAEVGRLLPAPEKIICLGLNYATHIREMGRDTPRYPTLFAKYARALIGPREPVVLPRVSDQVDWEAELGVVIGRECRHVPTSAALDAVAGYTVVNDVTVRDYQHRTREFLAGKTFESTTPVGPWLVTPDELPADLGLRITCSVDGELMQDSVTSDLLFDVAAIISYVSDIVTLVPGDLIATGTPGGVGAGRDPKVFLRPGQVLRTEIERIGVLENVCVPENG